MTEPTQNTPNERDELKARADTLGIQYAPNVKTEHLREKVNAALNPEKASSENPGAAAETDEPSPALLATLEKRKKRKEALALVRVRITCMDPKKREWDGESFTVGNSVIGTTTRYVPYDTEWHVERVMLNVMQEAMCQIFVTVKDSRGNKSRKGKLVKAYAIEELPPLSENELKELSQRQAMANGTAEA